MDNELIITIIGFAVTFLSGNGFGLLIEKYRLKKSQKNKRINNLMPHIERVTSVIEQLKEDISYYQKAQTRIDQEYDQKLLKTIEEQFKKYNEWYGNFQSEGLKFSLEDVDKELTTHLRGLFVHSDYIKKRGTQHIITEIDSLGKSTNECFSRLRRFMRY